MTRRASRTVRTRFATVPASLLHVGAARVAIVNALFAHQHDTAMLLRLDDADVAHRDPGMAQAIEADLAWLGLPVGFVVHQSEREALYRDAASRLEAAGRIYPCFESEEELRAKRDRRIKRGQPPIYDRAMLRLTPAQRAAAEAGGKRPYWRFRLSDATIAWHDRVRGPSSVKLQAISDPVVIRAHGTCLPVFASVVDDLDLGITHVIRSAEHLEGAGVEMDIRAALGGNSDGLAYVHLPVLTDSRGARLSRREGNITVRSLRHNGLEPAAVVGLLSSLGVGEEPRPATFTERTNSFDLTRLSASPARFGMADLLALNRRVLGETPFEAVAPRLRHGATEAFWLAVRGHIDMLGEARGWWDVVAGTIVPPVVVGEEALLRTALDLLPAEPWDLDVWTSWTAAIESGTGRRGRALVAPLRLALTGEEDGPDLAALLPLIGRARVETRLRLAVQ